MRSIGLEEITRRRVARLRGAADEGDALAVQGPDGIGIGVDTRSEEADGFEGDIIDADEAVITARRDENKLRAVGRPVLGMILAADNEVIGFVAGVKGAQIDL